MKNNIKKSVFIALFFVCGGLANSTMSTVQPSPSNHLAANTAAMNRCFFYCLPSFKSCLDGCAGDVACETQCMDENNACLDACEGVW